MISEERASLEAYLRERGQKMTSSRRAVLEAFLGIENHMTAEELHAAAKRIDPGIGQATVFRTIKLLSEAGIAREACRDEGPRRYEHAFRHEHHDHVLCLGCGAIVEFKDEGIEREQAAIYRRYGFKPAGHRFELYGYCPACSNKSNKE